MPCCRVVMTTKIKLRKNFIDENFTNEKYLNYGRTLFMHELLFVFQPRVWQMSAAGWCSLDFSAFIDMKIKCKWGSQTSYLALTKMAAQSFYLPYLVVMLCAQIYWYLFLLTSFILAPFCLLSLVVMQCAKMKISFFYWFWVDDCICFWCLKRSGYKWSIWAINISGWYKRSISSYG